MAMAGSVRGSYLGEVTGKVVERDLADNVEELDRRVLCMGFRCIFVAQRALKRLEALFPPSEGELPGVRARCQWFRGLHKI